MYDQKIGFMKNLKFLFFQNIKKLFKYHSQQKKWVFATVIRRN